MNRELWFLTILTFVLYVSNSLRISSLHRPQAVSSESNSLWSDCATIVVGVGGVLALVLKAHPGVAYGNEKDALFWSDDGHLELPFCEAPYQFSKHVAQLPSAILHMPLVLVAMLWCRRRELRAMRPEQLHVLVGLFVFQMWTGIGHIVPNPRKLFVQDISIVMSMFVLRGFVNAMTSNRSQHVGDAVFLKMLVFMLSSYAVFGLMPTIIGAAVMYVTCLNFMFNVKKVCQPGCAQRSLRSAIRSTMPDLTDRGKVVLGLLLALSVTVLALEVHLCRLLLAYSSSVSWHAPFDLMFWQGFWALVAVAAMSKPGSFWSKDVKSK